MMLSSVQILLPEGYPQGYYSDIYSAQEKWQEGGQKFRELLIDWHLKFHLTCIVWSLTTNNNNNNNNALIMRHLSRQAYSEAQKT